MSEKYFQFKNKNAKNIFGWSAKKFADNSRGDLLRGS